MVLNCETFFCGYLILNSVAHVDSKRFVQKIGFHEARTGVYVIVNKLRGQYPLFFSKNYFCPFMLTPTFAMMLIIMITTEVRLSVPILIIQ
jgi:hypothetical protein